MNLKLLKLIKCCAFSQKNTHDITGKTTVDFKIDVVNRCSQFIKSLHVLMYPWYY